MRPENYSNELLGMTRAKAKMYEYAIPLEAHIKVEPEEIVKLFPLVIGLLGDFSVNFYTIDDEELINELRNKLIFSAHFLDSYFNSKLWTENDDYYILLGSATYYLCSLPGSSMVLAKKLKFNDLNLEANKLENLLLSFLKNDFSKKVEDGIYIDDINEIIEKWYMFINTGNNEKTVFVAVDNLRSKIYKTGTPRELLLIDVISAVIKEKFQNSTWHCLPLYSELLPQEWQPVITKNNFIKELWQAQHLIGQYDVLKGKSATIQMPTSAGKTKATELIIRSAFLSDRTDLAVIVAPFRALCADIRDSLYEAFIDENINITNATDVYQNDFEINDSESKQIVILTPEKLLYIIRQTPELTKKIGLIIYDEGHQFDSAVRGTNYELLLSSLKIMIPKESQTVLISAVMSNIEDINNWLNEEDSSIVQGNNLSPTYRTIAFTSWKDKLGRVEYVNINNPDKQEYYVPRVIEQEKLQLFGKERTPRYFPDKEDPASISLYMGLKLVNQGSIAIFCGRKNSVPRLCENILDAIQSQIIFKHPSPLFR
ncbi:MAG: DEAD/DEAH box helicase [Candidatus Gastranaerophilales bacterium]